MTTAERDTIFALSSGFPPAAIAIVRVSGPAADRAVEALAGRLPEPRLASLAKLHDPVDGALLDEALVLRFPAPATATGEELAEFHLHGGRAVVAAVLEALSALTGLRPAQPGEFTRRAFENGRIDLAEAEGLADLLAAETQSQRRAALALAGGAMSRMVETWQQELLELSAALEASIDFADEGDVEEGLPAVWHDRLSRLLSDIDATLARPSADRLRDGVRVSIAGPPNAGKSSLLNALIGRDAAIISPVPGTTRDLVEAPVAIAGVPFLLIDSAGLRESGDAIEAIGVARARRSMASADLILWLGDPADPPDAERTILVQPKADLSGFIYDRRATLAVSARTGEGMDALVALLLDRARRLLPGEGEVAINQRHRDLLSRCEAQLIDAGHVDPLVAAEALRLARGSLDRITGRAGVEDMLDALFGRFCIGK